jgi:outer membrane biosynthesis protein TonB
VSKQALNQLEQDLREQLRLSESELSGLEANLKAVDDELVVLHRQHEQFDKLEAVCKGLEELDAMGAGHLFWDEESSENIDSRLEHARWEIGKYHEAVVEVETRKEKILEDIEQQNVELDYLHYDLQDIIEQEEARENEWVVERDDEDVPVHIQVMPWSRGCEEDKRFHKSLGSSLATALALILMVGMVAIPIKEREQEIELPERVAKLVRQERALPPPPPPMPEPEVPEEMPEPEPEPELVEEVPDEPMPVSNEEPQVAQEQPDTREQVKSKGILAFRDSFASRADIKPSAQLGLDASISDAGAAETGRPERMMVTTTAPGSSGGINLADYSRDFGGGGDGSGGGGMAGVAVSRVASSIGGGDGPNRPLAGGAAAGRTDEEIQIVFDRYKASLYRLYNRELRKDPTLRGQLVLRLTIEPDGSVSMCELHSASMNAPELAAQVVGRVKTFDFGAKEDIVAVTIIYPIDFLPAG